MNRPTYPVGTRFKIKFAGEPREYTETYILSQVGPRSVQLIGSKNGRIWSEPMGATGLPWSVPAALIQQMAGNPAEYTIRSCI